MTFKAVIRMKNNSDYGWKVYYTPLVQIPYIFKDVTVAIPPLVYLFNLTDV